MEFEAKRLANKLLTKCNRLIKPLKNGEFESNEFVIVKSNHDEAVDFSESGGLAFAIDNDHIAPLYGKNVLVSKKDKVVDSDLCCAWCLNIGGTSHPGRETANGYNSILFSFYKNKVDEVDYYLLLKKDL